MRDTAPTPAPVPTERQAVHSRAASARNPVVTESVARHLHFGRVTLGYKVALDDVPVFVGTSSECVTWADREMERGANWSIRDARGLVVDQEAWERRFAPGYGQSSHAEVVA